MKKPIVILLYFITLISTIWFSLSMRNAPPLPIDLAATIWLQTIDYPVFVWLLVVLTELGLRWGVVFATGAAVLFLEWKKLPLAAAFVLLTLTGDLLVVVLKETVGRPRPSPDFTRLLARPGDFGYPSGHAVHAVVFFGFLIYLAWTLLKPSMGKNLLIGIFLFVIVFTGISRVYLGAHWLSDVVGGYAIGFLWLSGLVVLYRIARKKLKTAG